jgi:hypothetical protein
MKKLSMNDLTNINTIEGLLNLYKEKSPSMEKLNKEAEDIKIKREKEKKELEKEMPELKTLLDEVKLLISKINDETAKKEFNDELNN